MRQEWIVGGIFAAGTVVGGALTWHVLRNQPNPAALDEEAQSKLNALPFRAAIPSYLPHQAEGPVIQLDADAAGGVRALLAYRTPQGCFGLLEGPRGLTAPSEPDAGLLTTRLFGTGALFAQPEIGSTVLAGSDLEVALVGPSKLGEIGCPTSLPVSEAKSVLESLVRVAPPPPPLPELHYNTTP